MPYESRAKDDPRTVLYHSAAWRRTRAAVLERDGHRCVVCRKPTRSVHHKTPVLELIAQGRDPLDPDECASLCKRHHGMADSPPMPEPVKVNRFLTAVLRKG